MAKHFNLYVHVVYRGRSNDGDAKSIGFLNESLGFVFRNSLGNNRHGTKLWKKENVKYTYMYTHNASS